MYSNLDKQKSGKASGNKIEIYPSKEGSIQIEVQFDGETVWLNQSQLMDLFQSSKANISEHIKCNSRDLI